MPTYVYECAKCGDEFEIWQSITDNPLKRHTGGCGGKLAKVIQPAGIVLKGSGFYKNDSRGGSKRSTISNGNDAKSGDSASNDAGSGESKAGESKSGESKSGESKSGKKSDSTSSNGSASKRSSSTSEPSTTSKA